MKVMDVAPWVRCLSCGAPIIVLEEYLVRYLGGLVVSCPSCGASLNWWKQVLHEVRDNFLGNLAFSVIGAQSTIITVQLVPGSPTHVKFTDYGVPDNAKLLYINYTPEGGLFPIEMHGNIPIRHLVPTEVYLWPRQLGTPVDAATSKVNIFLTWAPYSEDEQSWQSLVDAFEAYGQSRYDGAVFPANVAVELELSNLMLSVLEPVVGSSRAEEFLDGGVAYSHQLNVLLPFLASTNHLEPLPDHVRGLLNRLRSLRNDMAHRGRPAKLLERNEAAGLLCAALFGFRYLKIIRSRLQPPPHSARS